MPLINDVRKLLVRLWNAADWQSVFRPHGFDKTTAEIAATTDAELTAALAQTLAVDRTQPGFADFSAQGTSLISPGQPGRSLLYHALASADVHPTATGQPSADPSDYPTLAELDTVENYVYSLVADRTDLAGTFVAVLAYQYRPASRSTHRVHADIAYSRTGVARIGTAPANFVAADRSFWVLPADGSDGICVLPARYGTFLARKAKRAAGGSVQGTGIGPDNDDYVFPVHKLFSGTECLVGKNLTVKFDEFHRNEKLKRTHSLSVNDGGLPIPPGANLDQFPFVIDSKNGGNLVTLVAAGSSVLVSPVPQAALVRTVAYKQTTTGATRIAHFTVPARTTIRTRPTRFTQSTLEIPSFNGGEFRMAPEYVNIRHEVDPNGPATQLPASLDLLEPGPFNSKMQNGGYAAAHFVDSSCDGCVEATVTGIAAGPDDRPAFSLVTAPDFFPLADQVEIDEEPSIPATAPLSRGRNPVNPNLPLASNPSVMAFRHRDRTATAVVGVTGVGTQMPILGQANRVVSYLPDAASDVFAPGWDTSVSKDALGRFLTSSSLGSPFPEDAKLCAALSSFWPAVAPDASRTFGNERNFTNQLPMLDEELGFHPGHPRVQSGEVDSFTGWDGEFGPFFETVAGVLHVNYASIERSDYVTNALQGKIRASLTAAVQTEEILERAKALVRCQQILPAPLPQADNDCLVVVHPIADWATAGRAVAQLTGPGFLFEFARFSPAAATAVASDLSRKRRQVQDRYVCQIGLAGIAVKRNNQPFDFVSGA